MEMLVQIMIGFVAIGSFIGQTRFALNVLTGRLDRLETACYDVNSRLTLIEAHLRGPAVAK
jgi:hypothetical protein